MIEFSLFLSVVVSLNTSLNLEYDVTHREGVPLL